MRLAAADGEIAWLVTHGGEAALDDCGWSIEVGPDGHPVVAGSVQEVDLSASFYTRKYDRVDGAEIWSRLVPGGVFGADRNGWVAVDAAGDVIMGSRTWSTAALYDVFVQKYAGDDGATRWTRQYNSPGNRADDVRDLRLDGDGNVLIAGISYSNVLTLKLRGDSGEVGWAKTYNGPPGWYDLGAALAIGPTGEVITTGLSDGGIASGWDVTTIAYAPIDGQELWVARWDGEAHQSDEGVKVIPGLGRDLYVVGYSYGAGTDMDLLALRYELQATTAVPAVTAAAPLLTAHPNPFNPQTEIRFALAAPSAVALALYDLRGARMRSLTTDSYAAGEHAVGWDGRDDRGRDLPSGVYVARLAAGRAIALMRLTLVR